MSAAKSSAGLLDREGKHHVSYRQEARRHSRRRHRQRVDGQTVAVKGPKGELAWTWSDEIVIVATMDGALLTLTPRDEEQARRAMWGLSRTLVNNLVTGVTKGFEKKLEINGVGYRAAMKGKNLSCSSASATT
jgi:ribosomal protein L6P/L9E